MAFDLVSLLISIIGGVIIMAPVLWIVGRMLVGASKAKFTDAIMIVVLGSVANAVVGLFLPGFFGSILELLITLYLIKRYYECGWGKALAVAVVTLVVFIIIAFGLGLVLGISLFGSMF